MKVTVAFQVDDDKLEAVLDCIALGASEALADNLMDRPTRLRLVDVVRAADVADQLQAALMEGRGIQHA